MQPLCPSCHLPIAETYYFCPNCGASLKGKPVSISVGKEIALYALAFFLPPFGLLPAVKYLKQDGSVSRRIGLIMILLTVTSIAITLLVSMQLMSQLQKTLELQTTSFQQLGY